MQVKSNIIEKHTEAKLLVFLPDSEKDFCPFDFRPVPFDFSNIGLKEQEALRSYTLRSFGHVTLKK